MSRATFVVLTEIFLQPWCCYYTQVSYTGSWEPLVTYYFHLIIIILNLFVITFQIPFIQIIPIFGDCPNIYTWSLQCGMMEYTVKVRGYVINCPWLGPFTCTLSRTCCNLCMKNGLILPNQYSVNFKCREYLFSLPGPEGAI